MVALNRVCTPQTLHHTVVCSMLAAPSQEALPAKSLAGSALRMAGDSQARCLTVEALRADSPAWLTLSPHGTAARPLPPTKPPTLLSGMGGWCNGHDHCCSHTWPPRTQASPTEGPPAAPLPAVMACRLTSARCRPCPSQRCCRKCPSSTACPNSASACAAAAAA